MLSHSALRPGPLRNVIRAVEAHIPQKILRDFLNQLRFKDAAPQSDMAIFPTPRDVVEGYEPRGGLQLRRRLSGVVMDGDWDLSRRDLATNTKLVSCQMRWEQGADWEETPIWRKMLNEIRKGGAPDECRSVEDMRRRYRRLDEIFAETRSRGRLLRMHELPDGSYYRREHGATLLHLARDGSCLRSGGGAHRFAIAKVLDLPELPSQLGVVHPEAIRTGHLARLRRSRYDQAA